MPACHQHHGCLGRGFVLRTLVYSCKRALVLPACSATPRELAQSRGRAELLQVLAGCQAAAAACAASASLRSGKRAWPTKPTTCNRHELARVNALVPSMTACRHGRCVCVGWRGAGPCGDNCMQTREPSCRRSDDTPAPEYFCRCVRAATRSLASCTRSLPASS